MTEKHTTLFDQLALPVGNLAVKQVTMSQWGDEVNIEFIYRYPPKETPFSLRFSGVRSLQWTVVKTHPSGEEAQVLTHDLGEGKYQRTARIATVLAEIIISYDVLVVKK